jgi:predicted nucleic acid-binding protein
MIVVSDTGPLNYLALLGHLDVLPTLYGQVVIPPAVAEELSRPSSPPVVRRLIETPEPWLEIETPPAVDPDLADLGDGEQEAIVLARSLSADLLLCDDKDARTAAIERNVQVIGTVGVLKESADKGLLDLADALSRLRRTNFRISKAVVNLILEEHRRMR